MLSRSSVYKMLQTEAQKDHRISELPRPFMIQTTQYRQPNFSPEVISACSSYMPLLSGLKISKVIILGDVSVGKTSLVNRFCHQIFSKNYKATIGVDFEIERFDILGVPFNLQIWDTAGQERFKCIAAAYYRSAHAIITVFDLTSHTTLFNCMRWLREALDSNNAMPLIFLVGTKFDLLVPSTYKEVEKTAVQVAEKMGAEYWAVSSFTGDGVAPLFTRIAALTFDRIVLYDAQSLGSKDMIQLGSINNNQKQKNHKKTAKCQEGFSYCGKS